MPPNSATYQRQIHEADEDIESETKELEVLLPSQKAESIVWELDPYMGWTVFDDTGRMLKADSIIPEQAARPALGRPGIISTGSLWKGWRVEAFPAGPGRTIVIGYDMVKVHGVLRDLVIAYAWSLPLVVIVVAVGSWWATGRALAPFRKLADAIEGIKSENLTHRVPAHPAKDEKASFSVRLFSLPRSKINPN